jgi:hypothetical protein
MSASSILRSVRDVIVAFKKLTDQRSRVVVLLDRIYKQTAIIVEDYLDMFRKLERDLGRTKSDSDARKALRQFQRKREQGLLMRRALFAELTERLRKTSRIQCITSLIPSCDCLR